MEKVPPNKAWTQSGRTKKVIASEVAFDVDSRDPLPVGTDFQAMLRAGKNRDGAARGNRDYVVEDPREATSRRPTSIIFSEIEKKISPPAAAGGVGGELCMVAISLQFRRSSRKGWRIHGREPSYKVEILRSNTRGFSKIYTLVLVRARSRPSTL